MSFDEIKLRMMLDTEPFGKQAQAISAVLDKLQKKADKLLRTLMEIECRQGNSDTE